MWLNYQIYLYPTNIKQQGYREYYINRTKNSIFVPIIIRTSTVISQIMQYAKDKKNNTHEIRYQKNGNGTYFEKSN